MLRQNAGEANDCRELGVDGIVGPSSNTGERLLRKRLLKHMAKLRVIANAREPITLKQLSASLWAKIALDGAQLEIAHYDRRRAWMASAKTGFVRGRLSVFEFISS